MVLIIVPVYWRDLGPTNFLWFSDISLILMVPALWLENSLLASMAAVGVLPLEAVWVIDFISGGTLLGVTDYMFGAGDMALHLRILSGFHLILAAVILYILIKRGYDKRAYPAQIVLAALILPLTYSLTGLGGDNINWVYGPGMRQDLFPPLLYLGLYFAVLAGAVYTPMHFLLRRFAPAPARDQRDGVNENV